MKRNPRNLGRMVAFAATLLLVMAVSLAPGAMALGVAVVSAVTLAGISAAARVPCGETGRNDRQSVRSGDTALNFWPPGRMSENTTDMMSSDGRPPGGRLRKHRFSTSMTFRGDRIRSRSQRVLPARLCLVRCDVLAASTIGSADVGSENSLFDKFNNDQMAATMRASPQLSASAHEGKVLDFGLLHYRARDRDVAASMVAA